MLGFEKTLNLLIEHWPVNVTYSDPLLRMVADMSYRAQMSEKELIDFCEKLDTFESNAFERGVSSHYLHL
jgi:hypothetical protein